MALEIRQLAPEHYEAWDKFVLASPEGTFFHRAAWRDVIEGAFRHKSHYVFVERDGAITAVLPLVHVRSLLFGNRLISVPFCVYGGPIAAESESAEALGRYGIDLMRRLGADLIEFRMRKPYSEAWATRSDLYATFRRTISITPEENLKAIPRKQRAVVRKALSNGLRSDARLTIDQFYTLYAESVRNLGTPVFSKNFLRLIADRFSDCMETLTIFDKEDAVSTVLSFFFRDEVLPYYAGGGPQARQLGAFDFMYWEVMNRAAQHRGARLFDFGRSKFGTGAFAFKKNWGFSPEPLTYQYWLSDGRSIPDNNPLNPKYRLLIEAWKRLPLPVANLIGPAVSRGIG